MRKIIIFILAIIIVTFVIPVIFTNQRQIETMSRQEEKIEEAEYEYSKYGTIKLLHNLTGEVEELDLDNYLLGVVSAEMPVGYDIEALKAQAVVARTYTIYTTIHNKNKHENADICDNSSCCQAWISKEDRLNKWEEDKREENWRKIEEAVSSTKGKIVTYNGEPINAFFHSNSGGTTEIPINVWGGSNYPYLQVIATSGEDNYSQYQSVVELTKEEVLSRLKEKHEDAEIDWKTEEPIKILEYTESGRVRTVKVGNVNLSGVEARSIFGLKSANFETKIEGEKVIFSVKGYGHGVGLSQTGSDSLAKQGKNYEEIIKHFYKDIEITNY